MTVKKPRPQVVGHRASVADGPKDDKARASKYARTRVRILDATAHVLSVKGYAGTRLSDVAECADIRAPAIYYYFSSRDELIEEVMACGLADMRTHLQAVLDTLPPETSPLDRILAAVEAHLRHELEISDYTTASIRNSGQIPDRLRTRQLTEEAGYGAIWRRLFENAVAHDQIRSDLDPRIAQLLVLGALNWTAEWWDPRRAPLDAIVAAAQTLVRAGIGPDEGTRGATQAQSAAAPASRPAHRRHGVT
jgi:TetR/AcrR family transcriptional regulator, cholesterol catabolism regulator